MLVAELQELYDGIAADPSWPAARDKAMQIGRLIAENIEVLNDQLKEDYDNLIGYLRHTPMALSRADWADMPGGSYNSFRKKYFGRIKLVKAPEGILRGTKSGPMSVDAAYQELMGSFPEWFQRYSAPEKAAR